MITLLNLYRRYRRPILLVSIFFLLFSLMLTVAVVLRQQKLTLHALGLKTAFAQTASASAILYGRPDSFGQLASTSALPTGQSLQTIGIASWGFNPGQSEFFSTLAPNGEVVLGTNPQTDNQTYPTADHMSIAVFNATENTFRNIVIPTSTGALKALNPFFVVGGGSVETLLPVTVDGTARIAFISLAPYSGWNVSDYGEYPSLGFLDLTTGSLQYNQSLSKTATQLHAASALGQSACPMQTNIFGEQVGSCRGMAEMDQLPKSKKLVITQYFPDPANGQQSGRLIVMGTDGNVAASYTYPNISNGAGGYRSVNPREVVVDPTSSGSLEYFSVIFDVFNNGTQEVFTLQEFAFNRTTNQIIPISAPILTGQKNASGQEYRFEAARYDSLGNLWVTQAVPNSLIGGPIVVYSKNAGVRKLETTCKVSLPWNGSNWKKTCSPDRTIAGSENYGQTRSFVQDPQSKTMFAATISGYLLRIKQSGSGASLNLTSLSTINMGLDILVDRPTHYIGVRKGVVDTARRILWVPVVQVATPQDCSTWPGTTPCEPALLDQWLYRFDLSKLAL